MGYGIGCNPTTIDEDFIVEGQDVSGVIVVLQGKFEELKIAYTRFVEGFA